MELRKVWSIEKRLFQDDFKRRIIIYNALVASVLMYGIKVWK